MAATANPGVRRRALPSAVSLALTAVCFGLALAQRPGQTIADTKLALYVAPHRFLHDVLAVWSPTADLGHVWGGQYNGYAFPMAPWFAAGDSLGLPVWLVHRLWLGTLLTLAALGTVRLLATLVDAHRPVLHLSGGLLYVVCPYVAVLMDRTSISLLAYAALPWMLVVVHRGLHDPRRWTWPAAGALLLACTGGGVNAAVTGWVLVAPLLLVAYELAVGGVAPRALGAWALRLAPCVALANAWWVVPLAVHARYGLDFLPFTEQPGTIWSTTSLPESLRGMGFWTSYIGVGFGGTLRPYATSSGVLLTALPVVVAGLLVPALVVLSLRWTHRARYAPFFLLLLLTGLLIMGVGWPEGTPLRRASTFTYNHVSVVRVLRTTYKAGPLVTLALAALGGMGAAAVWAQLAGRPRVRTAVALGAAGLVAVAAWPLARGVAPDEQLHIRVPDRWRALAAQLDRRPDDQRALVLPGQLFASYRWGQTIDAILPSLTDHPVATRNIVPYADRRSVALQWAVDDLVSQERALPGQLPPLLDLMGVGDVVVAADGDRGRSGELGPLETAAALGVDPALRGGRTFGSSLPARPAEGRIAAARRVPALRDIPVATGGLLRVLPARPLTVYDGGAQALTGLAAFGALDPARPYAAAADLTAAGARAAARAGGPVVIADGVRRQAFVASRLRGGVGAVLPATRNVSEDGTILDPYEATGAGADAQTVAVFSGVRDISAPFSPQVTQFPEHRPAAALDGDLRTAWLADRFLAQDRAVLRVDLGRPRTVPSVSLYPASDARAVVTAVSVNGRRFAVHRGWNTLPVRLGTVRVVQVAIAAVRRPRRASAGAGGIRELRIPGVRAHEALRVPALLQARLRPADLGHAPLTYLLERFTAAAPLRRARLSGPAQAGLLRDATDPEARLDRVLDPPVARRYAARAWARVSPQTPDHVLDRVAGVRGDLVADSSARYDGLPRWRASGAFDGSARRSGRRWIGQWIAGEPAWLAWRTRTPLTMRRLRLVPVTDLHVRHATRVRLTVDGRAGPALAVDGAGIVALPATVRGRVFRLDILAARFPAGTPAGARRRRAVGVAELRAAGLPVLHVRRRGRVTLRCGSGAVVVRPWHGGPGAHGGTPVTRLGLGGRVDLRALDAGRPLALHGCGTAALPAAPTEVTGGGSVVTVDRLQLAAAAPRPVPAPAAAGRITDPGRRDGSGRSGASARVVRPAWLVYGQSYNRGWRATCDGRDLGAPVPLQGYANAWPLRAPGCRALALRFGPERSVHAALLLSAVGGALLLMLLLVGALRGRGRPEEPARGLRPLGDPDAGRRPMALPRALAWGAAVAAVGGFVFALRAGVVLGPLVAVVLARGVRVRPLITAAGALLAVAVPALYAAHVVAAGRPMAFDTTYATDRLAAHWVAVGAFALLALALVRLLAAARAGDPGDQ